MTAGPRDRALRCAAVAVLAAACAAGCRDKGTTGGLARTDPLMGGRIPPQNVPVPDRGTTGGKAKPDPLVAPAGRPTDRTGAGYTDDPQRWKGAPYSPSDRTVPAALAGRQKDDDGLKIESPGVTLQPAGGPAPGGDLSAADPLLQQLRGYGLTQGNYTFDRTAEGYMFRANVPISGGTTRGYSGTGPTAADAVKQVLDQVKADRGK
ncbi:MAG: hypothetical protein K2P78_12150 [Gemmataceae bacterium]|nr:hypothetical protein [Gemmataceae bacterium]